MPRLIWQNTNAMTETVCYTTGNRPLNIPNVQSPAERDAQLVSEAKAGSKDAFSELQNLYSRRLYNTVLRITKNHEDAEDVLQETFLRVHLALDGFEGRSSFYSWASRIAINSALMVLRRRRARPEFSFDLSSGEGCDVPHFEIKDSSPNPEQIYHEREQLLWILRSIDNLQPKMQETMQLSMDKECSMKEIARTLGISVASAKSRLYRARRHIASKRDLSNLIGRRKSSSGTQLKATRIDGCCSRTVTSE
jgi:RNA polymerase sigma-70 factor, ECF subfamily